MMKYLKYLLTILLIALVAGQTIYAKDNPDDYKVVLTLHDGTIVNGFLSGNIMGDKIKVSETFKGKTQKYKTADIESLVFPATENDDSEVVFTPMMVHDPCEIVGRNPKSPRLLMKIYETDKMIGYVSPAEDFTFTPTLHTMWGTMKYYYYIKGEKRAHAYWKIIINSKVIGLRKMLKGRLDRFPLVKEYLDHGNFDSKEFFDHPEVLMPVINEAIESGNYDAEKN